jgi:hypothetical protein
VQTEREWRASFRDYVELAFAFGIGVVRRLGRNEADELEPDEVMVMRQQIATNE